MQPTPIFLPAESHGQRSLMGYSPSGDKESDTTEGLNNNKYYLRNAHTKKYLSLALFFIYLTNLTGQPVFLFAKFGNSPQEIREGNGNPLQYSCLENPVDRGAWWAAVCRVA